ncbi:MAG: LysR family transcriptional regulator [Nannocystaceae bacterium]|nr:LysR family transcriptional regulator [bacterium]
MDLNAYRAFVLAVEHGTITDAAADLGVSRPTLSRQLAALEDRLGLALLHRTTRSVRATPRGRQLYEQLRPIFDDVEGIEARLHEERREPTGWLRVSVPPVIANDVFPALDALRLRHPKLRLEFVADIRWADVHSDEVDVAVRAGRVGDPSLVQRRLGSRDVYAVASPEYLDAQGRPESVDDLSRHLLLRGQGATGDAHREWPLWSGARVPVDGPFVSNDQRVLLQAALLGRGITMLSDVSAGKHVAAGRLVRVLPDEIGARLMLHAVFARRTLQPASVRACIDALVEWADGGGPSRMRLE